MNHYGICPLCPSNELFFRDRSILFRISPWAYLKRVYALVLNHQGHIPLMILYWTRLWKWSIWTSKSHKMWGHDNVSFVFLFFWYSRRAFTIYLSIYLWVYLFIYPTIYLSIFLSLNLSSFLSLYLFMFLLSVYFFFYLLMFFLSVWLSI